MTDESKVSVAVPVFNGEQFIEVALSSVLAQTRRPDEFRVYDNASTDASATIARSLIDPSDVVERDSNIGASGNFNDAVCRSAEHATYFLWLAADDRLMPEFINRTVEILDVHPDAPACLTGVRFIDNGGRETGRQTDVELASEDPAVRFRSFLRRSRWTEFYCLYRRASLLGSPMLQPEYGADVLLTWWFLLRSPLAVTDEILFEYRIGDAKSVDDVQRVLSPTAGRTHWQYLRLRRRLLEMTHASDLDPTVARTARRELRTATLQPVWMVHLAADVVGRWPKLRQPLLFVRDRLARRKAGDH